MPLPKRPSGWKDEYDVFLLWLAKAIPDVTKKWRKNVHFFVLQATGTALFPTKEASEYGRRRITRYKEIGSTFKIEPTYNPFASLIQPFVLTGLNLRRKTYTSSGNSSNTMASRSPKRCPARKLKRTSVDDLTETLGRTVLFAEPPRFCDNGINWLNSNLTSVETNDLHTPDGSGKARAVRVLHSLSPFHVHEGTRKTIRAELADHNDGKDLRQGIRLTTQVDLSPYGKGLKKVHDLNTHVFDTESVNELVNDFDSRMIEENKNGGIVFKDTILIVLPKLPDGQRYTNDWFNNMYTKRTRKFDIPPYNEAFLKPAVTINTVTRDGTVSFTLAIDGTYKPLTAESEDDDDDDGMSDMYAAMDGGSSSMGDEPTGKSSTPFIFEGILLGIDFKLTDNKFYQWCAECQIGEATAFWESVEGFGGGFWYRPSDGETRKDFLSSQDIVSKDMVPGGDFSELFLARFDKELLHLRMKMRDDAVKKSQAAQMQAEAKKKAHVEQQHYTPEEAAVLCRREEIAAAAEKRSSQAQQGRGATPPAKGNPSKWSVFLSNFFTRSSLDDIGTPEEFEKKIDDLIEEAQQNVDHSSSLYTSGPVNAVPKKPIRSGGTGAYVDLPGDTAEVIKKKGPETRKEIQKEISEKKKVELLKKKRNMPAVVEMV